MKVVSWNVNGLRATLKSSGRGLRALLDSLQADIICMQETKATSQLTHPDWLLDHAHFK